MFGFCRCLFLSVPVLEIAWSDNSNVSKNSSVTHSFAGCVLQLVETAGQDMSDTRAVLPDWTWRWDTQRLPSDEGMYALPVNLLPSTDFYSESMEVHKISVLVLYHLNRIVEKHYSICGYGDTSSQRHLIFQHLIRHMNELTQNSDRTGWFWKWLFLASMTYYFPST